MQGNAALVLSGATIAGMLLVGLGVQAQTYALPEDPSEPVIVLDYQGGRLKRIDDAPALSILADGRVQIPQLYAHTRAYEGRISSDELQDLLRFILDENRFFDREPEALRTDGAGARRHPLPLHLASTVLRVQADQQVNEVRYRSDLSPARAAVDRKGSAAQEVFRLLAIEHRLEQIMAMVKLGGPSEVARWLESANDELGVEYPDAERLVADDLEGGTRRADGSVHVRFVRRDDVATTSVTIDLTANGERYVTVAREGR